MKADEIKQEFEIRKLKNKNEELNKKNCKLDLELRTTKKKLNARIIKEVDNIQNKYQNDIKYLKRKIKIKEDLEQRLEKKLEKQELKIEEKDKEIEALKTKILQLTKKLDLTQEEKNKYMSMLNLDGTTSGISTSNTPINKKKIIPNTREKSNKQKGGQLGHKKHKLERFNDNEINEEVEIKLEECPKCGSENLILTGKEVTKDELDYEIKIIKRRYKYKEYECKNCHSIVRKNIPNKLKEENQYGEKVQAHALALTNIGNVPINKVRRIISGLTSKEIILSEGYISKLQKRASNLLEEFIKELREYIIKLNLIHWDDTVIFINGKQSCLRSYCNEKVVLYKAHERKNKEGLDEDDILSKLTQTTKVVHDHNKVNYNEEYNFTNIECCVHLERDLKKVKLNIEESTWSMLLKELFTSYNKKRKEYIKEGKEEFSFEQTNEFMIKFDEYILLGIEENKKHGKSHYYTTEKALLKRLMEYRDNYTYWIYDFSIPYTNNTSERSLRLVKSKMKVSGQFSNITNARYYANIKSYIETCHRNGINEVEALTRLLSGKPFTIKEITNNIK